MLSDVIGTIKATLEASDDGTLHLPLPPQFRHGKFNVIATVEEAGVENATTTSNLKGFGCLKGKIHLAADFDAPLDDFTDYME